MILPYLYKNTPKTTISAIVAYIYPTFRLYENNPIITAYEIIVILHAIKSQKNTF